MKDRISINFFFLLLRPNKKGGRGDSGSQSRGHSLSWRGRRGGGTGSCLCWEGLLMHVLANQEVEKGSAGAQPTSSSSLSISSGPPAHGTVLLTSRVDLSLETPYPEVLCNNALDVLPPRLPSIFHFCPLFPPPPPSFLYPSSHSFLLL